MRDDPDFNIQFVRLIKENSCLYDHTNADYNNRDIQDMAWERIARQVSETVFDCKERWKNLRACYTRYLKFLAGSSESPGNSKFRRPYYLAEYLNFLKPFTKPRKPKASDQNVMALVTFPDITNEENSEDESEGLLKKEYFCEDNESQQNEVTSPVEEQSLSFMSCSKRIKRDPEHCASNDVTRSSFDVYQLRQNFSECRAESEDADFLFLRSILPDMKEMNKAQKRKFKIGILNLAGEILNEIESCPVRFTHPSSSTSLAAMSASHQPEGNRGAL
ncbi:hypothetical protein R5R35_002594 [Gryllus longicercus]|uniref:MADF domain-containing protein n=1 Tax=Gryllus longicercus TaxID=2509291 RepID=A0AAN9ZAK3_9ORTH